MAMGEEWLLDGHLNLGQSIVRSSSAAHVITQFIMLEALWRPSGKARRSFGESEMAAIPAKETTKTWGPLQHSHHLHLQSKAISPDRITNHSDGCRNRDSREGGD
jgi:hypothetical protein